MFIDAKNITSIAEVAAVLAGFPFRGAIKEQPDGNATVVQMRNTTAEEGINWASASRTALPGKKTPRWLEDGDVLFAARGAKNYAVHVSGSPERAVCSPHFFIISEIDRSRALPAFIAWQINQSQAQNYFDAEATGSHIRSIRKQVLEDLKLALPPIERQSIIVEFVKHAHAERSLYNRLISNRHQQLTALALGLFTEKGVQDHER